MIPIDAKIMPIHSPPLYNVARSISAQNAKGSFDSLWNSKEVVQTYSKRRFQIYDQLHAAVSECIYENWDGEGAKPASDVTIENARQFLLLVPQHLPLPDITVDHDGEISFEWYVRKYRSFSLSIGENRLMSFAGRMNSDKWYGVSYLSDSIPDNILTGLTSVLE